MRSAVILGMAATLLCGATAIVYEPGRPIPSDTLEGPLTVNGSVTMTTSPMSISGPLTAGPAVTLNTTTLNGATTVAGACTFSQPPTGLVRMGSLVRGSSLGLSIGCQTLGTAAVTGTTLDSGCMVTQRPAAILSLGVVLDCYVTTPGTVTIRACALVALLTAPSGTYGVTLVGE